MAENNYMYPEGSGKTETETMRRLMEQYKYWMNPDNLRDPNRAGALAETERQLLPMYTSNNQWVEDLAKNRVADLWSNKYGSPPVSPAAPPTIPVGGVPGQGPGWRDRLIQWLKEQLTPNPRSDRIEPPR